MPVATSSRRRNTTRGRVSEDIEEDLPTQKGGLDDVDEEKEERPSRRAKTVKKETAVKEKKPQINKPDGAKAHGNDVQDPDDDDAPIDVANFEDRALSRADQTKLQGLSSDWSTMYAKVHQHSDTVGAVANSIAEIAEDDEGEKALSELDILMQGLIDVQAEMKTHQMVLHDIHQKVAQGEEISNAIDRYTQGVQDGLRAYTTKTTRQKYAKNDQYVAFKQGVYEVAHDGAAMPPITDFIPKEDGDDSDDDDEVEMGGVTQDYKCPLTLTPLVDPVTSNVCGHSFSEAAIRESFRSARGGSIKCPASGCTRSFTLANCKPDKELAKKVKAWERRARRQEEDDDAEEVIE